MFSVCILLYGDFPDLASRCLQSIRNSDAFTYVKDIRIGLNSISHATMLVVEREIELFNKTWSCPVITYEPFGNSYKYPTMRRMFWDEQYPLADYVMWFDDDSYICAPDFWERIVVSAPQADMLGQRWMLRTQGHQWEWIQTTPWYNPKLTKPTSIAFAQGAWWVAKTQMLADLDWPMPELKHCGGDSMLGEAIRHKGYKLKMYDYGVRINADENGAHSKAIRRGYSERVIGHNYNGQPYPVDHHNFGVRKWLHRSQLLS